MADAGQTLVRVRMHPLAGQIVIAVDGTLGQLLLVLSADLSRRAASVWFVRPNAVVVVEPVEELGTIDVSTAELCKR